MIDIVYSSDSPLELWTKVNELIEEVNKLSAMHKRVGNKFPFPVCCSHDFHITFKDDTKEEPTLILKCDICGILYPVKTAPEGALSISTVDGGELSIAEVMEGGLSLK